MSAKNCLILVLLVLGITGCERPNRAVFAPTSPSSSSEASTRDFAADITLGGAGGVDDNRLLAAMRTATARFHNIDAAFAAGYVDDGFGCIDAASFGLDPAVGGMGFHLINESLHADPETDPMRPDILVYAPAEHGNPKLVALEYEVFRPDWHGAGHTDPPTLLGQLFESFDFEGLQIYGLHVWLWRNNPSGMFQDFNPNVACH